MSDSWGSTEPSDPWGAPQPANTQREDHGDRDYRGRGRGRGGRPGDRGGRPGDRGGRSGDRDSRDDWGQDKQNSTDWGHQDKRNSTGWGHQDKRNSTEWGHQDNPNGTDQGGDSSHSKNERDQDDRGNNNETEPAPPPYRPQEIDLEEEAKLQADAGENFKRYKEQTVTCFPVGAVKPIEKFQDVIESKLLLKNVSELKYNDMTPIQRWAMPAIKEGQDIIGCAQTGSGKTAAFLLPILQNILKMDLQHHDPNEDCQNPYCLIISPTRELARQIYTHAKMLSKDSFVKSCVIYGQVSTAHLKAQLSNGCHILVATLGRLKDFVERRWIGFKNIKYIVLDEGDRLIDDGFKNDIAKIFENETMPPKVERQTLFFSATFKKDIQANAKKYLNDSFVFLAVGKIGASNEDIKQEFLQVARPDKKRVLREILGKISENDKAIIFTQTKFGADMLAGFFSSSGLLAASIHGDRHQYQREQAISLFRKGERRFLISSPVGNRGLDLPKVGLVINYDLPDSIDEYVHRIGRTGRAGHTGLAISFVDLERDGEILPDLLRNLKDAKQEIPEWLSGSSASNGGNDDWTKESSTEDDWTKSGTSAPTDDWTNSGESVAASTSANNNRVQQEEDWGSQGNDWSANSISTSKTIDGPVASQKTNTEDDWGGATILSSQKRPAGDDTGNPPKKLDSRIPPDECIDEW